jgi:hypothetical protein
MYQDLPFNGILGKTKELDLLQFMIAEPNDFYNISDLSDILGMHRDTVSRIIEKFETHSILEFRPGRGRSKCYRLNGGSKIVKTLDIMSAALIDESVPGIDTFESTLESFLPYVKNKNPLADPIRGYSNYPHESVEWVMGNNMDIPSNEQVVCSPWNFIAVGGI